jgi:hypothetical protein
MKGCEEGAAIQCGKCGKTRENGILARNDH